VDSEADLDFRPVARGQVQTGHLVPVRPSAV